jgi:large conductance mechanosensitive channel
MLKGFRDFIMRGNVVDLAVGVVIGAAFTGMVTAFTNSFLKPLISLVGSGEGIRAGAWKLPNGVLVDWAGFVNAVITFFMTAAVLYFLVVFPMNKLTERLRRGEVAPPPVPSEEIKLLTEIRDALVAANRVAGQRPGGTPGTAPGAGYRADDPYGHLPAARRP